MRITVTAGASGIGRAMAEAFLSQGAQVAICDVDEAALADFSAAHPDAIEKITFEDWRACLAVNLDGAFLTARRAAKIMKAQGNGLLLFTSSTAETLSP